MNKIAIDALRQRYELPFTDDELIDLCFSNSSTIGVEKSMRRIDRMNIWRNLRTIGKYVLQLCMNWFVLSHYSLDTNTHAACVSSIKQTYRQQFFTKNELITECALLMNPGYFNEEDTSQNLLYTFLGYIYLQFGIDAAYTIIVKDCLNTTPISIEFTEIVEPKTALQEITQRILKEMPTYTVIGESGPDHQKEFTVQLNVGRHSSTGTGASKKIAEANAAKQMLQSQFADIVKRQKRTLYPCSFTCQSSITGKTTIPSSVAKWFSGNTAIIWECLTTKSSNYEVQKSKGHACDTYLSLGSDCFIMLLIDSVFSNAQNLDSVSDLTALINHYTTSRTFVSRYSAIVDDVASCIRQTAVDKSNGKALMAAQRDCTLSLMAAGFVSMRLENKQIKKVSETFPAGMNSFITALLKQQQTVSLRELDATSTLQTVCQALAWKCEYSEPVVIGPEHIARFKMTCSLQCAGFSPISTDFVGDSKKVAKHGASATALKGIYSYMRNDASFSLYLFKKMLSNELQNPSKVVLLKNLFIPSQVNPFIHAEKSRQVVSLLTIYIRSAIKPSAQQIARCKSITCENQEDANKIEILLDQLTS